MIFEDEIELLQRKRLVPAASFGTTLLHNDIKEPLLPPLFFSGMLLKMSSRKQFCVKINEQLVDGLILREQETPLLRTAVCPIITTCKETLSSSAAGVRAGKWRGYWERKRQEESFSTSGLV